MIKAYYLQYKHPTVHCWIFFRHANLQ